MGISYGTLSLYTIRAARLSYAERWKDLQIPSKEEWWVKLMEWTEMAKLTAL